MMHRFCAVTAETDPAAEISLMGGHLVHQDRECALGILGDRAPLAAAELRVLHEGENDRLRAVSRPALRAVGDATVLNRKEILAKLAAQSSPLPDDCSDVELLLCLYARLGATGLALVRGVFSLAVWDGEALVLCTDPLGARSIFYARAGGYWAAASSLRALRRWPRLPVAINLPAVRSFLTFAYVPGDETLLRGVRKVPPGSLLRLFPDGRSRPEQYWEPEEGPWNEADPPEAFAFHLRTLLEEATVLRLPKDEDVGIFLSGGIDSSLVTALAARLHDRPVRTYTVCFGERRRNELTYANAVAEAYDTRHTILSYNGREIAAAFAETVALMDCPVGEGLTVPNLLMSRRASEDGLKVIFNGEGGDPCFGGPKNIPMLLFELHRSDPDPATRAEAYLRAHRHLHEHLGKVFTPEVQQALLAEPPLEALIRPYLESPRFRYYLNRLMFANLRLKGPGYMLPKVEFITSAQGLEGRYPLFDIRVVEYSFRIPPAYKLSGVVEKRVLKQAVEDLLPKEIIDRPKSGMQMPMGHWLKGPLKALASQFLLDDRGRNRGLFNTDVIEGWLNGEGLTWGRYGQKIWLLLTLEAWLRAYVDTADFVVPETLADMAYKF